MSLHCCFFLRETKSKSTTVKSSQFSCTRTEKMTGIRLLDGASVSSRCRAGEPRDLPAGRPSRARVKPLLNLGACLTSADGARRTTTQRHRPERQKPCLYPCVRTHGRIHYRLHDGAWEGTKHLTNWTRLIDSSAKSNRWGG